MPYFFTVTETQMDRMINLVVNPSLVREKAKKKKKKNPIKIFTA